MYLFKRRILEITLLLILFLNFLKIFDKPVVKGKINGRTGIVVVGGMNGKTNFIKIYKLTLNRIYQNLQTNIK